MIAFRKDGFLWPLLVVLGACAGNQTPPDWIDNPHNLYPAATYLSAVGGADDRATAADRALANLAKVFTVTVSETSEDVSGAQRVMAGDGTQIVNTQSVSRQLAVETSKVLEGAVVSEYWQSQQGRVYALATLQKAAAANRLRSAIMAADREVQQSIDYASHTAPNPIAALRALTSASQQQQRRELLNQDLMIVTDGQGVGSRYDSAGVNALQRDALAALQVSVAAQGDSLVAELQRALAQLGVEVVNDSNLRLTGSLDLAPVEAKNGWFWQRGSYELIFADGGEVLARQRWPLKVSATESGLLASRLRDELNRRLPGRVIELLSTQP